MADIDIGSPPISQGSALSEGYTRVNKTNPANGSGKITSVELYCAVELSGCEIAIFYIISGDNMSTRAGGTVTLGTVTIGEHSIANGNPIITDFEGNPISLTVEEGDYIGMFWVSGLMRGITSGYAGYWYRYSDDIPCDNENFAVLPGRTVNLYGTGTTLSEETLEIGEAFSIADSKVTKITKGLSESFSIVDTLIKNVIKNLAETLSVVDSWIARINSAEAFSIADSLVKNVIKQLAETLSIADSKVTKTLKVFGEAFSIADNFVHNVILRFYEVLSVKDSFKRFFYNLYTKISKGLSTYTKVGKGTSTYTKIDKADSDYTKKDKERGEEL